MEWFAAQSVNDNAESAWAEVRTEVRERLGDDVVLLVVFASRALYDDLPDLNSRLNSAFPRALVFGGVGRGTIGGLDEYEEGHSLSVMAMGSSPGIQVEVLELSEDAPTSAIKATNWDDVAGTILLLDPFSMEPEPIIDTLYRLAPNAPIIGGMLSGGEEADQCRLFTSEGERSGGGLVLVLRGALRVEALVAQGCRPIGEPLIVLRRRAYLIDAFDRGRPMDVLQELIESLPAEEREHAVRSLFVGLDVDEARVDHESRAYLIRNLIGVDAETGSLAVAAQLRDYQVLQFHVRDGAAARADMQAQLRTLNHNLHGDKPAALFAFCCVGRGMGLFGQPHQDIRQLAGELSCPPFIGMRGGFRPGDGVGNSPASAGLFCAGEIGPVAGKSYVHSYTACAAYLIPRGVS